MKKAIKGLLVIGTLSLTLVSVPDFLSTPITHSQRVASASTRIPSAFRHTWGNGDGNWYKINNYTVSDGWLKQMGNKHKISKVLAKSNRTMILHLKGLGFVTYTIKKKYMRYFGQKVTILTIKPAHGRSSEYYRGIN